jgi:hypothetical protein
MTNTQKPNILFNLDNKDDRLIVGSYLKNQWQHRKEFFGKKLFSHLSQVSVLIYLVQLCEHCNSLSGIKQFLNNNNNKQWFAGVRPGVLGGNEPRAAPYDN